MIGYTYTIENKYGDSFKINDHVTDPLNVIALQSYPDMDVDIKNNEVDLDGQHGIWDFYSFFGKRNISFSGVIVGEDEAEVETMRRKIVSVLALPLQPTEDDDGYVTISWEDALGISYTVQAKMTRSPRFDRDLRQKYRLNFLISFKASDPFILGGESEQANGVRGYFTMGVTFPITLPAIIGQISVGTQEVDNDGTMYAHTKIRLSGEAAGVLTNPRITNLSTGAYFQLDTTLANNTKWLEIDSRYGTVVDQDGVDKSAFINEASTFLLLKPGVNTLIYTANEGAQSPAGVFTVVYNDTSI